ncbi:MAG: thiamine-phosphate pyrophosphorylase [Candidatus Omnitrophota bacterium]
MAPITLEHKGILRILDANINRAKEGLRVVEDIARFIAHDNALRIRLRRLRHQLDVILQIKALRNAIAARNSNRDLGRPTDILELSRARVTDVLYSNLARVKESLRVIEEFSKLIAPSAVAQAKEIRYRLYALEKEVLMRYGFKRIRKK